MKPINFPSCSFYIYLLLICTVISCAENTALDPAFDLSVNEGFKDPQGFYDPEPVFSWKLPNTVQSQSGYSIAVATHPDLLPDKADLWISRKINSSQSLYVPYDGKDLSSGQKVYWQIKYWDEANNPSSWSTVSNLELGLLKNSDWQGQWIGLPTRNDSITGANGVIIHTPQYLRKSFTVKPDLASARLYATAKGVFEARLNGQKVGDAVMTPGWSPYEKRLESLTFDITRLLQPGDNTIGFQLASGWHYGRLLWNKQLWSKTGSPKILGQLVLTYQDGSKDIFTTDQSWYGTTKGPIRFSEIYDGEIYDANYEISGWSTHVREDESWLPVETSPLEDSIHIRPKRHSVVKNKMTIPTSGFQKMDNGAVIFDLKQNMVGVPAIKVPMLKGDTLKIRFSEMLTPDGEFYTDNYRSAHSTDYYVAAADGIIEWHPTFTFHGFRYVELSGFDTSREPAEDWVKGIVQYSDFESNGSFHTSHKKLNQLQSNIIWGLRGNFFDIPTDCPQRDERLGWTGDAQVFAPTSMYNADVHAFWSSWLQTLNESQFENGGIPFVAPDALKNGAVSSGWGDAAAIIPWDIYFRTGDTRVLEENYEMIQKWIDHHKTQSENHISSMNTFGDWLQPFPAVESNKRGDTSKNLIGTAFFAHSAHLASKIATVLNQQEDAVAYDSIYKAVSSAFEEEFFDEDGKVKNGEGTQTAYLLALQFDLLTEPRAEMARKHLLHKINEADNHLRTGFLGTPLLPRVLDEMEEFDLMYQILFNETYPSWFYSINQGATTMWERWNSYSKSDGFNPEKMNSLNHYAYGAIGEWMYERIGGIKPLQPGYKEILIAPVPGNGLTHAETSYDSPYGLIKSAWKVSENTFELQVTIPPNTSAMIRIPTGYGGEIKVDGEAISSSTNMTMLDHQNDDIHLSVLPGRYSILVTK